MIAFSVVCFFVIATAALFPTKAIRKCQKTIWWDFIYPFTGVVAWFLLAISNIGASVSLSNFLIEVFWITVLSAVVPWLRWFMSKIKREKIKALSFALTFLPIAVAVAIRLTMPSLPE